SRSCEKNRPAGPTACSPGREGLLPKAPEARQSVAPAVRPGKSPQTGTAPEGRKRLERVGLRPSGPERVATHNPASRPGLHSVAPPALLSNTPVRPGKT